METHFGFIHEPMDIKILILYLLRRLPAEINGEQLWELMLVDGGFNYFDYKDCLAGLVRTAQIEETKGGYRVTAKGARNGEVLEDDLPYSVRVKADRVLAPVIEEMRRSEMILANHEVGKKGVIVYLALNDGIGTIFDLKILAADENHAKQIEKNFRRSAEDFYHKFITELSE